jgi:hypothetical protein
MKLAREETKIKVTGRSFYCKNNLKFKGRNRNRNQSRNRNQNRNLGKMARFRNTAPDPGGKSFADPDLKHKEKVFVCSMRDENGEINKIAKKRAYYRQIQ